MLLGTPRPKLLALTAGGNPYLPTTSRSQVCSSYSRASQTRMCASRCHSHVRFTLARITQYKHVRHTDIPHNHVLVTLAHQQVTRWLSAAIREAIGAISQHYPHCDARPGGKAPNCGADNHNALAARAEWGVPLWSSEDYSCWTDTLGAGVWASEVNSNFIGGNITMTSAWYARAPHLSFLSFPDTLHDDMSCANQPHATRVLTDTCLRACNKAPVCQCETKHTVIAHNLTWALFLTWLIRHLVSAFYPTVSFWNEGLMSSTQPWSGSYVASPTLWVTAHTTQFTKAGVSRCALQHLQL